MINIKKLNEELGKLLESDEGYEIYFFNKDGETIAKHEFYFDCDEDAIEHAKKALLQQGNDEDYAIVYDEFAKKIYDSRQKAKQNESSLDAEKLGWKPNIQTFTCYKSFDDNKFDVIEVQVPEGYVVLKEVNGKGTPQELGTIKFDGSKGINGLLLDFLLTTKIADKTFGGYKYEIIMDSDGDILYQDAQRYY